MLDASARRSFHRRDVLSDAITALEQLIDRANNRLDMKFEEIQTELTDREVKADTLSATEQVVTVVLTLFLTPAPVLARKYIQRARVAQDANRLQVVKQSSGTARSAIDKQLQTLRAELAVGDALRAATNADIQFTVSNIDGEITMISVDAALD